MTNPFNTRVWISQGGEYRFQEIDAGLAKPDLGICFSGGGTRAMSAAMGQLRAVCAADRIGNVDYIASVSGGSWASTIFTFIQDDGIRDQDLVGSPAEPEAITVDALMAPMAETCMGYGATSNFLCTIVGNICLFLTGALDADRIWIDAVGQTLLAPFGIDDAAKPRYFSMNPQTVARISEANPALSPSDFITVRRPNRPFLVVNSAMVGPAGKVDHEKILARGTFPDLVGFQYTPLYVGAPASNGQAFQEYGLCVGNGFIEPFAFGGAPPAGPVSPDGTQALPAPPKRFTLTDAAGTSSAAYGYTVAVIDQILGFARKSQKNLERIRDGLLDAEAAKPETVRASALAESDREMGLVGEAMDLLAHIHDCVEQTGTMAWWKFLYEFLRHAETLLAGLLPQQACWPVTREGGQRGADFDFTDGGNIENYGIIALLLRKVKNIVVFINTDTPMKPENVFDQSGRVDFSAIDSTLASLFGYAPQGLGRLTGNLTHNQVFAPSELRAVVADFAACMGQGGSGPTCSDPLVSVQNHTVCTPPKENWWGVENGFPVRVCWVYLATPATWYNALDASVRELMEKPEFSDFPHYKTIGEEEGQLVRLSAEQVRLLAHMTCWTTMKSDKIQQVLGG